MKPQHIVMAVVFSVIVILAFSGVFILQTDALHRVNTEPPDVVDYSTLETIHTNMSSTQRQLLKYYETFNSTVRVELKSENLTQVYERKYKVDYKNKLFIMEQIQGESLVSERVETRNRVYVKHKNKGIYGVSKLTNDFKPVDKSIATGIQLVNSNFLYEKLRQKNSNPYNYAEFKSSIDRGINIPFISINPNSFENVESTIRIDSNNVIRYIKYTSNISADGKDYTVTVIYKLRDYGMGKSYSIPEWAKFVDVNPEYCSRGIKPIFNINKNGGTYTAEIGISELGKAENATLEIDGTKEVTFNQTARSVILEVKPKTHMKFVSHGKDCSKVLVNGTVRKIIEN